jgi:hypothetical protein
MYLQVKILRHYINIGVSKIPVFFKKIKAAPHYSTRAIFENFCGRKRRKNVEMRRDCRMYPEKAASLPLFP